MGNTQSKSANFPIRSKIFSEESLKQPQGKSY
jgi:hypothetical protein